MRPAGSWALVCNSPWCWAGVRLSAWVALAWLVLPGGVIPAVAAPVNGIYEIPFTANESIWPLESLSDCEEQVIDGIDISICLGMSFNRNGAGDVDGSGTFDFTARGIGVEITGNLAGPVKGSVKGTDRSGYKQSVTMKFKGTVSVGGAGGDMTAKMTGKLKTSISTAGVIETKGSVKVKVQRGGTTKVKLVTGLEQLDEGSGDWVLKLNITASADQTKLSGTAELMLPDGSQFIPVEGVYKPKSEKAQIRAKGKGSNKGLQIEMKGLHGSEPGFFDRGNVSYDVQGFSGGRSLKVK